MFATGRHARAPRRRRRQGGVAVRGRCAARPRRVRNARDAGDDQRRPPPSASEPSNPTTSLLHQFNCWSTIIAAGPATAARSAPEARSGAPATSSAPSASGSGPAREPPSSFRASPGRDSLALGTPEGLPFSPTMPARHETLCGRGAGFKNDKQWPSRCLPPE